MPHTPDNLTRRAAALVRRRRRLLYVTDFYFYIMSQVLLGTLPNYSVPVQQFQILHVCLETIWSGKVNDDNNNYNNNNDNPARSF